MSDKEQEAIKAKDYVFKTIINTSMFVGVSILTKLINLIFNVLIARIIFKETFGLATVYLNFIYGIILFFPRETIRKTTQKYCPDKDEGVEFSKYKECCELTWVLNFLAFASSFPLFGIFMYYGNESLKEHYVHLILYIACANVELFIEPIIIYMNLKIDSTNKLIATMAHNYSRVISNYFFAYMFGMQIWSFTLSRILATFVHVGYTYFIGIYYYGLSLSCLFPSIKGIKALKYSNDLRNLTNTFTKTNSLKLITHFAERIVLGFFLQLDDSDKAEYTFVVENFSTFLKFFVEPAEENFYNLVNKIKNYKNISIAQEDQSILIGDFAQDKIFVKEIKEENKIVNEPEENYSVKILKNFIKFFLIFGIMLFTYVCFIGKDLVILIFTDKWATESTINIFRAYSVYISIIAVSGMIEAYSNAVCTNEVMKTYNSAMVVSCILLISLSIYLTKFDITGLVWAGVLTYIFRMGTNLYLIISNEEQPIILNSEKPKFYIVTRIFNLIKSSFMKTSSLLSILISVVLINSVKFLFDDESERFLLVFICLLIGFINTVFIILFEKKDFMTVFNIKGK